MLLSLLRKLEANIWDYKCGDENATTRLPATYSTLPGLGSNHGEKSYRLVFHNGPLYVPGPQKNINSSMVLQSPVTLLMSSKTPQPRTSNLVFIPVASMPLAHQEEDELGLEFVGLGVRV